MTSFKNTARSMAEALERGGIASDPPNIAPDPYRAAREAFYIWNGRRDATAWRDLREWITGPSVPRAAFNRKLAELCLRALRHHDMPHELIEPVSYARGYFDALVLTAGRSNGGHNE